MLVLPPSPLSRALAFLSVCPFLCCRVRRPELPSLPFCHFRVPSPLQAFQPVVAHPCVLPVALRKMAADAAVKAALSLMFVVACVAVAFLKARDAEPRPPAASPPASSLCVGRYERLALYFEGILLSELRRSEASALLDWAAPHDKLLMQAFLVENKRYLQRPPLASWGIADTDNATDATKPVTLYKMAGGKGWRADFSARLVSSATAALLKAPATPAEDMERRPTFTADYVVGCCFAATAAAEGGDLPILSVDLRNCGLIDDDLEHLPNIFERLPKCQLVDLRRNRIQGATAVARNTLTDILGRGKSLNIVGNPVASVNRKEDFFASLAGSTCERLIWIPEPWLDKDGWRGLIVEPMQDAVLAAHRAYYSSEAADG